MSKRILCVLVALSVLLAVVYVPAGNAVHAAGTTYYVDADQGNDALGNGTDVNPWKTIGKAAEIAQAGDTVKIRSGVYRETVTPAHSGTAGNPITYEADAGADVTISGAELVTTPWSVHAGNVYKTTTTLGMGEWKNQVYVDGTAVDLARWPNAGPDPMHPVFNEVDEGTDNTKIVDAALTQPDGYWDGAAVVVLDKTRWGIASSIVSSYTTGQLNLGTIHTYGLGIIGEYGSPYYLIGKLAALDGANEWYYDSGSTTLYLQTADGSDPTGHEVEVKARNLAFDLDGKHHIRVKGIDMFASTVDTTNSSFIELDGIDVKYPSHYELTHTGNEHNWKTSGILLGGSNNVLKNSTVAYSPGNLVTLGGENNQVVNNLLHDAAYGPFYTTETSNIVVRGEGHLVSHNTMYNSGRAMISGTPQNARIQYNLGYNAMQITDDGAFMYFGYTDGDGTEIHHNIFKDAPDFSPPHNIVGGIYLDHGTANFKIYNNVVSNVPTFGVFLHYYNISMQVYNNTFYNSSKFRMKDDGGALDAYGTRVMNNISYDALAIAPGLGVYETNNFTSGDPLFNDTANGDLALQGGSTAIDAGMAISGITDGFAGSAPDIGAYESGQTIWQAGHDFANPPNPSFATAETDYMTLLYNGFFEIDRAEVGGWTKTHGQSAVIERSQGEASASRYAWTWGVKLGSGEDGLEQTITGLKPDTEYELRGFVKAASSNQAVRLGVKGYGGTEVYEEVTDIAWKKKKMKFTTGATDTSATVYIYKPTTGGYAYADDITLMEVDPDAPEEMIQDETTIEVEPGTVVVNDSDVGTSQYKIEYTGNWYVGNSNIGAYKGDASFSNETDAYYQVRFEGEQVRIFSEVAGHMGIAGISIDGGAETMVDLYSDTATKHTLVYTSPIMEFGPHTLQVRVTGDKNANAGGTWLVADRIDIVGAGEQSGEEPEAVFEEVLFEDFESSTVGQLPDGWIGGTDGNATVTQDTYGEKRLTVIESADGSTTKAEKSFDPLEDKVRVELRVMAEQIENVSNFLTLKDSNNEKVVEIMFDQTYSSTIGRHIARRIANGGWATLQQYEPNQWYDIQVEVDLVEGIYSVAIDGVDMASSIPVLSAASDIVKYEFSSHRWDTGTFHVDDLRISATGVEPPPAPTYGVLQAEDFESTTVGAMPAGWTFSTDNPVSVTADVYGNHRLTVAESANGTTSSANLVFDPIQETAEVELRMMAEQMNKSSNFLTLKDSNDVKVLELLFDRDTSTVKQNIARRTAAGWVILQPYEANQWYDVHVGLDFSAGTYDVTIDGVEVAADIPFLNAANDIASYSISSYRYDKGTYHIDDLKISGPIPAVEETGVSLSGPDRVEAEQNLTLTYRMEGVESEVYANSVTVNYDPDLLEYVPSSAVSLIDGYDVVGESVDTGTVTLLGASTNGTPITGTVDLISLTFQALVPDSAEGELATISLSEVVIGDADGDETALNELASYQVEITLPNVDKTALQTKIAEAQALYDVAVHQVHDKLWGHYPSAVVDALNAAIAEASGISGDPVALQAEVDSAEADLATAMSALLDAANESAGVGDLAVIAAHYNATSADEDWVSIEMYDVNDNGSLDITDLSEMAKLILE